MSEFTNHADEDEPFVPTPEEIQWLKDIRAKAVKKPRKKRVVADDTGLDPIARLSRDLRDAARILGDHEARFLVDYYYKLQKDRIRCAHQVRTLAKEKEPNEIIDWFTMQAETFESQMGVALDRYSTSKPIGEWARSIVGIGPVIVAGLMANIDIQQAPTVGHIWRFGGYDPTVKWLPKTKRPWNASLKRLFWLIGESFTKFAKHDDDIYGKLYLTRKAFEIRKNDAGDREDQARQALEDKKFGKETDALAWYSGCYPGGTMRKWNDLEPESRIVFPDDSARRAQWLMKARNTFLLDQRLDPGKGVRMLPPARIQLRSQRYAVKLFLSHFHHVFYEMTFNKPPPLPYVLSEQAHVAFPELAVHTHFLAPPNWPMITGPRAPESPVDPDENLVPPPEAEEDPTLPSE
jgi:hypothetical protein